MAKIKSFEELTQVIDKCKPLLALRHENNDVKGNKKQLLVCGGTGCQASRSKEIIEKLNEHIKNTGISDSVTVDLTGCFGFCAQGPIVKVMPDDVFYVKVKPEDVSEIINEHIINNRVIERLLFEEPTEHKKVQKHHDMSFYKKQMRIALRNCGLINPENIDEYLGNDGYRALGQVLTNMSQEELIDIIKNSGLRGRGGAGFPTGLKWEFAYKNKSDKKYVVCNADEGDPGAFMDRSILEGDPHSIIEAMALCGYAIGADEGKVYIRAEYPLAINRLKTAIKQAKEYGLLGENILGTGFNFKIDIKYGAGAFVCGEETALIHSMEGERGEPSSKPPFPAEEGYRGKPTNVNNVETLANIPEIILKGAEWFKSIGTEKSSGTKVFALAGKINNIGLVEVPMGTTLREVIFDIGGGIPDGKKFKAVQTGGPSGGCLTEKDLETPIDFDTLVSKGSMMGSGGMIVMDEDDCMPSVAKFYLEFTEEESCGKCTPCRIGTRRLSKMLDKITEGNGTMEDLKKLKDLSQVIIKTSLCGLGQTAPNPILSTLREFEDEYIAHIRDHKCPAGQCANFLKYEILENMCIGCTACSRICPTGAISGEVKKTHIIGQDKCIKCGACIDKCKFSAITRG